MKKWERLVNLAITETGAKVLTRKKVGGHLRLTLQLPDGRTRKITTSSSPAIEEHAALAVKREVLTLINSTHP